ncbi:MAG: AsnC family transcriptional regulator [Rhodobacterales bacterium]|nr:MAG: AsnC family transcriptional regulator [Rhodobacterales bacterium]
MDDLDNKLIAALRRDARMSISDLAGLLGVTRGTVRARIARLEAAGAITGYTVLTKADAARAPVRGLMMLGIEGRGTEKVMARLQGMSEVEVVYTTNGTWDLIAVIGTDTLEHLDEVLFAIRRLEGVTRSETNLLLSTRRAGRAR